MKIILVLCTGNSCRSQMMQGYLENFAKSSSQIYSAGIETHGVNPTALQVMKEDGIDISGNTSNHIDEYRHIEFDLVITVCDHARENCPWFPSKAERLHQSFEDPAQAKGSEEEILQKFRQVRDEIKSAAHDLANKYLV